MISLHFSRLYDQTSFYKAFLRDLAHAHSHVIIEGPFITEKRMRLLLTTLSRLRVKGMRVIVYTKPFEEYEQIYHSQAIQTIGVMRGLGVEVLMTVGHHRKLAIIDKGILWEGSLDILSQNDSCEVMRRIKSHVTVKEILRFTNIKKWC